MDEASLRLELDSPSPVTRTIKGEIAWEPVRDKLDEAYVELGKNISLKGFRKGKVPRPLLAKMFHSRIAAEISHNLVQEALVDAIGRLELRPVLPIPSWDVKEGTIEDGKPLAFSATLEVLPQVEAKTWEGLEVKRHEAKITDEDVDRYLHMKQEELTQFLPVEGVPIDTGHIVHCDVMGKVGTEAVSMEHLAFLMPAPEDKDPPRMKDPKQAAMAQRLGQALRGRPAQAGELDLTISFDDTAPEAWRGKEAQLLVDMQAVRERKMPALDDDFAKDSGEADSLSEFREVIKGKLLEAAEEEVKRDLKRQLEDKLVEANPVEVTSTLVERQLNSVMDRARLAFQIRGLPMDSLGMDNEGLRDTFRASAEREVKKTLLTDSLARRLEIKVSDEDLDKRLTELAEARGESMSRVKAEYEKEGHLEALRVVMREEKVIDLLLTKAHVTKAIEADEAGSGGGEKDSEAASDSAK